MDPNCVATWLVLVPPNLFPARQAVANGRRCIHVAIDIPSITSFKYSVRLCRSYCDVEWLQYSIYNYISEMIGFQVLISPLITCSIWKHNFTYIICCNPIFHSITWNRDAAFKGNAQRVMKEKRQPHSRSCFERQHDMAFAVAPCPQLECKTYWYVVDCTMSKIGMSMRGFFF